MLKSHFCGPKKKFKMHLRPLFNVFFYADSESVFNFVLSCLKLEKLELKIFKTMHNVLTYCIFRLYIVMKINIYITNKMAGRSFQRPFRAFRNILEKCLLEEMCLELKNALKNVLKNVQEAILLIPKNFQNSFEAIF